MVGSNRAFRNLLAAPFWKRSMAVALARMPGIVLSLLSPLIAALEMMPANSFLRDAGWRLFLLRRALLALAGALHEAGGFPEMAHILVISSAAKVEQQTGGPVGRPN
jgi:hypothetical protein